MPKLTKPEWIGIVGVAGLLIGAIGMIVMESPWWALLVIGSLTAMVMAENTTEE